MRKPQWHFNSKTRVSSYKHWFLLFFKVTKVFVLLCLLDIVFECSGKSFPRHQYTHTNTCRHITPEPRIYLNIMFDTSDFFFPPFYTERRCVSGNNDKNQPGTAWATCLNGHYHCVTRYRRMKFLRITHPKNTTLENARSEEVYVPVACECSSYIISWQWSTLFDHQGNNLILHVEWCNFGI